MVNDFLRALGEFKVNIEHRDVDFNAGKTKQFAAEEKPWREFCELRKYSSGDVDLFGQKKLLLFSKMLRRLREKSY